LENRLPDILSLILNLDPLFVVRSFRAFGYELPCAVDAI
jgi:hypothetical protein